jgi:gamma-polyglutamate synthase
VGIPLLLILLLSLITLLLMAEVVILSRRTQKIALRISVSGTRGKSGTTRDLASVLRLSGLKVLAKTTGSGARYILPDGSEEAVPRRGIISILEQKRVIAKAAALGVDCLVTEIMSIHPGNHKIESQRIIKPHLTILTNFRADHLDVAGGSLTETESVYLNDISAGTRVFVHRNHISPHLESGIAEAGATLVAAEPGSSRRLSLNSAAGSFRIEENLDLVYAVAGHLGVKDTDISAGIETALHDTGRPELFTMIREGKTIWFANTFAANDPLSTTILMDKIIGESGIQPKHVAGILSLRSDRAERTQQWIEFLQAGAGADARMDADVVAGVDAGEDAGVDASANKNGRFGNLFVAGKQRAIVKRMVPGITVLKERSPERITEIIYGQCPDRTIVFGLANIAGLGSDLVDYWRDRAQGAGHRAQGAGHRAQGTGHRAQGTGRRAQGTGRRAQGTGRRIKDKEI